jgi:hypothetical protein
MQYIWNDVQIEDILEAQALARERGKLPGESYEVEFLEIMKKKGIKPSGATELNKSELLQEYASHDKKIAHIEIDDKGNQSLKIHKKEE